MQQSDIANYPNTDTLVSRFPQIALRRAVTNDCDVMENQNDSSQLYEPRHSPTKELFKQGLSNYSSPPLSSRDRPLIPDDEVISQYLNSDTYSLNSHKVVRFSEPHRHFFGSNQQSGSSQQRYRKQCSIPTPVFEDVQGEKSKVGEDFRIKDDFIMNQSTNLLHDKINLNNISLDSSMVLKTLSSQTEKIHKFSEELAQMLREFFNNVQLGTKAFTFDEHLDSNINDQPKLQGIILQKALDQINYAHPSEVQIEEMEDRCSRLTDQLDITQMKMLTQLDQIKEYKQQISELNIKTKQQQEQIEVLEQTNLKLKADNEQLIITNTALKQYAKQIPQISNHRQSRHKSSCSIYDNITVQQSQQIQQSQRNQTNTSEQQKIQAIRGKKAYDDGTIYYGSLVGQIREGYGILKYNGLDIYMGFWQNDNYNGYGHLRRTVEGQHEYDYRDLTTVENIWIGYQGEFQNGQFNGYGILTLFDNSQFHGTFRNGVANGKCSYYGINETITGEWYNNMKI